MKKFFDSLKKYSLGLIIGTVVGISFAVYANSIASTNVSYSHSLTSQTTVKGTLDELISETHACMHPTTCPEGYTCRIPCKAVKQLSELHTETCNQTSSSSYCRVRYNFGHTVTYGTHNAGISTGQAFDCDVLGDGSYEVDGERARFYYVSTKTNGITSDPNMAVLVFYTNTYNGVSSTSGAAWATSSDTGGSTTNTQGPVTAIKHLPGSSAWPGVTMNQVKDITYENNNVAKSDFYFGHTAARLLTYQEVYAGCYNGSTNITSTDGLTTKCEFLFENTKYTDSSRVTYGPWLEAPNSSSTGNVWYVNSNYRSVRSVNVNNAYYGVRPAIEVPLSGLSLND